MPVIAMKQFPVLLTGITTYGDTWKAYRLAYEMAWYDEHGSLPLDAILVDHIENTPDGGRLIVHSDPDAKQQ